MTFLVLACLTLCLWATQHTIAESTPLEPNENMRVPNPSSAFLSARALQAPVPTRTADGEFEHAEFWARHGVLLSKALIEFGLQDPTYFQPPIDYQRVVSPAMFSAVSAARRGPSLATETQVRDLWPGHESIRGVHISRNFSLLSQEMVQKLRDELTRARESGIPLRRPNGMNRRGVMLDQEVDGGLATLGPFVEDFVRR